MREEMREEMREGERQCTCYTRKRGHVWRGARGKNRSGAVRMRGDSKSEVVVFLQKHQIHHSSEDRDRFNLVVVKIATEPNRERGTRRGHARAGSVSMNCQL